MKVSSGNAYAEVAELAALAFAPPGPHSPDLRPEMPESDRGLTCRLRLDWCSTTHGDADGRPSFSPQKTPVREKGRSLRVAVAGSGAASIAKTPGYMSMFQTPDARTPPKMAAAGFVLEEIEFVMFMLVLCVTCR